ncbi:MAG: alpha-glucosidase C-terminal domain-containing protein [Bacteroidales bacterium]|nr:alpha-glucosidase C-terminal domain-containing protein [Bacteroidales bacterium]
MKKMIYALLAFSLIISGCGQTTSNKVKAPVSKVTHPEWSQNANIYEVNLRQYTEEGTLGSFIKHMPRLRNMGVDILWFMPIHPIGELNRKGTLGSYYSVQDYKQVNTEFGSIEEFQMVVKLAHELGMYVIIDWVANHTAWDHDWVTRHPDWYAKNEKGEMFYPADWKDVVQLDYNNMEMRDAMIDALKFWITEADIDGYRCDVASMVPTDFWENARMELDKIKPVFLLAEADKEELLMNAFDMDYGWKLHHIANEIAQGKANANDLQRYFDDLDITFPQGAYRMNFTSNHDENTWKGTEFERLGDAAQTFFVLMATVPGMPLIYTGQEAAMDKRLNFFEKDVVDWKDIPLLQFYRTLLNLKKRSQALWNGNAGGPIKRIYTHQDESVYAYTRSKENNTICVILNLSGKETSFQLQGEGYEAIYKNVFSGEAQPISKEQQLTLAPWEYLVLEK